MHCWSRAATWVWPDSSNAAITRLCSAAAATVLRRRVTDDRVDLLVRAPDLHPARGEADCF
jgi:hypothetical protein